jgi:hypothetical protein
MRIAAVMVVRNEADILPVNIAYHRSIGVTDFWITDNGSTDGTTEVLRALVDANDWLRWRSEPGAFHQGEFASGLAQDAWSAGAEWIVPIDAGEFWSTTDGPLPRSLELCNAGALACQLENFVQSERVRIDDGATLMTMTYCAEVVGSIEGARELVESRSIGFVEMAYPPKLIHRASRSLIIGDGNHAGIGHAGDVVPHAGVKVLHAPIRSRARLAALAEHGRRAAETSSDPDNSWHLRRWADLEANGDLNDEWFANSYRDGELTVGGFRHGLVRDERLRSAVAPFTAPVTRWLDRLRSMVA